MQRTAKRRLTRFSVITLVSFLFILTNGFIFASSVFAKSAIKTEFRFTKALQRGSRSDDVKQLQEFLKKSPKIYPEGLITGYFGPLTEAAVKKLQGKYGIEIVGVVGPKTRQKLNELSLAKTAFPGEIAKPEAKKEEKIIKSEEKKTGAVNDPFYSEQWALQKIRAEEAWKIEKGSSRIVIAVIDSGVDYNHPDLAQNIWQNSDEIINNGIDDDGNGFTDDIRGWDFLNNDNDPMDDRGHGTLVAGIIAAVPNNGIGVAGLCWECKIMPLKISKPDGKWENNNLVKALRYAADNGASIISMSLGLRSMGPEIEDAFAYVSNKGIVVVISTGNDDANYLQFPLEAIAVAATERDDTKLDMSNYGTWIDVAAPGENIYSTAPTGSCRLCNLSGYASHSGTSFAAPQVAGVVALLRSKNPALSLKDIREILTRSARKVNSILPIGAGMIDVASALAMAPSELTAEISSPKEHNNLNRIYPYEIVRGVIPVVGSATGEYEVFEGNGFYPVEWNKIGSGSSVVSSTLAFFNTSEINDGIRTIKLVTKNDGREIFTNVRVFVGNREQNGWPVKIRSDPASAIVTDTDKDGVNELIVSSAYTIEIYSVNGTRTREETANDLRKFRASVADLNGDGLSEIITVSYYGELRVYKQDLSILWNRSLGVDRAQIIRKSFLVIADLEGDGKFEIILATNGKLHVYRTDGTPQPGFPVDVPGLNSSPSIGDLNNDGRLEILTKAGSRICGFDDNGKVFQSRIGEKVFDCWNGPANALGEAPQVIADLNGDGKSEVIVSGKDEIYALDYFGKMLVGFPVKISARTAPAIGDLDNDGKPEIVVGIEGGIAAINWKGELLAGWPIGIAPYEKWSESQSPIIGDVNGDGHPEVITITYEGGLRICEVNGACLKEFSMQLEDGVDITPLLADFDNDGLIELIVGTKENLFHVFNLSGKYSAEKMEWKEFQHDEKHTGLYKK